MEVGYLAMHNERVYLGISGVRCEEWKVDFMRILIAEDERDLNQIITERLKKSTTM